MKLRTFVKLALLLTSWLILEPICLRAATNHLVISEIQISGTTATDEFVELYNPTETPITLTHFKLQKKTASGSASNLVSDFPETSIAPHGYFLIVHPSGYTGITKPDLVYNTSASLAKDNTVVIVDNNETLIDLVGWGVTTQFEGQAPLNPTDHQSLERLPGGELGNGNDTDSNVNDFNIQQTPNPQSSASLVQPIMVETPVTPTPIEIINNDQVSPPDSTTVSPPDIASPIDSIVTISDPITEAIPVIADLSTSPIATPENEPQIKNPSIEPTEPSNDVSTNPTSDQISILPIDISPEPVVDESLSSDSEVIAAPETQSLEESSIPITTSAETPTTTNQTTNPTPNNVSINEFLPNPISGSEWVELKNIGTELISLEGCSLRDGNTANLKLAGNMISDEYRTFSFASSVLNNDGDLIRFVCADVIVSEIAYGNQPTDSTIIPAPQKGQSLARMPDGATENYIFEVTTTPTPAAGNVITKPFEITTPVTPTTPVIATAQTANETATQTISTATPLSYPPDTLTISELYPVPYPDEEEWIEILNPGTESIPLAGWTIADARGTNTPLTGKLDVGQFLVVPGPRGHLNNDRDRVDLFDPTKNIVSTVTYENVPRGESYARLGGQWQNTVSPTKGAFNVITIAETETDSDEIFVSDLVLDESNRIKTTAKKTSSVSSVHLVTIEEARLLKSGTLVRVKGVVSMPLGVVGTQTFYIAGSGLQIYVSDKTAPSLAVGDIIEFQGKLGSIGGEVRIVVSHGDTIKIIDQGPPPESKPQELGAIGEETEGWLVSVEGILTEKSSDRLILEDEGENLNVILKFKTSADLFNFKPGDKIRVVGVVSQTKSGYRLIPRSLEDLSLITPATTKPTKSPFMISPITIVAGLILAILALLVIKNYLRNSKKTENRILEMPLVS